MSKNTAKVSFEKPPIWEEANSFFKLEKLNLGTIFTYGDTIYNPSKVSLTTDLMVHEMTHMKQQSHDINVANLWWKRYIAESDFRIKEEVEAYGNQYRFICTQIKDRNKRDFYLRLFGDHLSGPMYGNCISKLEAMKRIRKGY